MKRMKVLLTILLFYGLTFTSFSQEEVSDPEEILVSNNLKVIKLSNHVYIHTCKNDNGIIFVKNGEALIVSTPDSETETRKLVRWTNFELDAEVKAYVIDRWHPDAMGGLNALFNEKIKTYAYEETRKTATEKGLPVPEVGFDSKLELIIGGEKVVCHFLGPAHTHDGIVVWIPSERVLFGGNEVRSNNGWCGNIGDANLGEWADTIAKVKETYDSARIVIPGHGKHGGPELLDYTINLFKPGKWGKILRTNNIEATPVFNSYGNIFETAKSGTVIEEKRHLTDAVVFVLNGNRYAKIQSSYIVHDVQTQTISSDFGRLQIYETDSNRILEDLYYKQMFTNVRNDAVGWTIILKEIIR